VPVLGYISVSTVSKKRIFISRNDLPAWPYPAPVCDVKTLKPTPLCWFKTAASPPDELKTGIFIPIDTVGWNGNCDREHAPEYTVPTVYYTCADCRYHLKGKTQKPAFWIDQ
jgi:hypothetical protein